MPANVLLLHKAFFPRIAGNSILNAIKLEMTVSAGRVGVNRFSAGLQQVAGGGDDAVIQNRHGKGPKASR